MRFKCDFSELDNYVNKMQELNTSFETLIETIAKEIASELLARAKERTPVGKYSNVVNFTTKDGKEVSFTTKKSKNGGVLRNNWAIAVKSKGTGYQIVLTNNTKYAEYVEYGHNTPNRKGWVQGKFMMTTSVKEINEESEGYINEKIRNWLRSVLL